MLKKSDRAFFLLGFRIIGDFGVSIAAPVIIFVLVGKWLDARYSTKPLFIIIAFVLAFATSAAAIYRKAKTYNKEYQQLNQQKNNQP